MISIKKNMESVFLTVVPNKRFFSRSPSLFTFERSLSKRKNCLILWVISHSSRKQNLQWIIPLIPNGLCWRWNTQKTQIILYLTSQNSICWCFETDWHWVPSRWGWIIFLVLIWSCYYDTCHLTCRE